MNSENSPSDSRFCYPPIGPRIVGDTVPIKRINQAKRRPHIAKESASETSGTSRTSRVYRVFICIINRESYHIELQSPPDYHLLAGDSLVADNRARRSLSQLQAQLSEDNLPQVIQPILSSYSTLTRDLATKNRHRHNLQTQNGPV